MKVQHDENENAVAAENISPIDIVNVSEQMDYRGRLRHGDNTTERNQAPCGSVREGPLCIGLFIDVPTLK